MKKVYLPVLTFSLLLSQFSPSIASPSTGNTIFNTEKLSADFTLRYESSNQDNPVKDASALTLRSRLAFFTGTKNNFSARIEAEDVRIIAGINDYTVGPTGFHPNEYSVIADPETTELDQAFLQFKNEKLTIKFGRQLLTYDNHRYVGHVGWRQDRQTFDALRVNLNPSDKLTISYNYIDNRRRIFSQDADINSSDHLIHATLISTIGTVTAYAYLLEKDNHTHNSLDTFGLRVDGQKNYNDFDITYVAEFASQKSTLDTYTYNANYLFLEGGVTIKNISTKLAYESLGSDNSQFGFSTPLATLHAHNGWADMFLNTPASGLIDLSLKLSGKFLNGTWTTAVHRYNADKALEGVNDYGKEFNVQYIHSINQNYRIGIKYAYYQKRDETSFTPDTRKFWVWVNAQF